MKDLIEMYNEYRTATKSSIEEAYDLKNTYDVEDFNVSVITLFNWVRLEYKRDVWIASGKPAKHKNLKIEDYNWCKTLRKIVMDELAFSRYFKVDGDEILFSDSLTETERKKFCEKVVEDLIVISTDN